jgi:hypothetical protein
MTGSVDLMMIAAAAEAEGSTCDKVLSRDRHYTTTRARAAAVWLVFKVCNFSFREIGCPVRHSLPIGGRRDRGAREAHVDR